MAFETFDAADVKEKLTRDSEDPLAFFRAALAEVLPKDRMHFAAFVLQARLLLATKPGRLAGYPAPIYAMIELELESIARDVLPASAVDDAVAMLAATR